MYTRRIPPKLGALQRWVRECDATSAEDVEAMKCLDMILRIASTASTTTSGDDDERNQGGVVRGKGIWKAREGVQGEIGIWEMMQDGRISGVPGYLTTHSRDLTGLNRSFNTSSVTFGLQDRQPHPRPPPSPTKRVRLDSLRLFPLHHIPHSHFFPTSSNTN